MSLEEQCRLLLCNGHVTDKDTFQTLHLRMLCNMASLLQTALGTTPEGVPAHTHVIGDVTGLQTALDGKAATSHSHAISDVTGLQTALDSKIAPFNFTTSEQVYPHVTVNGTPIYARLYNVAAYPNSTTLNITHGITGLTGIYQITAFATNGSNFFLSDNVDPAGLRADIVGTNLRVITTANFSTYSGYVRVMYMRS